MTSPYDKIKVDSNGNVSKSGPHVFNRRDLALFYQARNIYALIGGTGGIHIWQGSYHKGTSQSAGTHDGGGAIDSGPTKSTTKNWNLWRKAQRICGLASFDRPYLAGEWDHHNHTLFIGNKYMSGSAKRQVQDYYVGRNALASHKLEAASIWRPGVLFVPSDTLPKVSLHVMIREAKAKGKTVPMPGVKHMQKALNLKMHGELKVDGIYGTQTIKTFKRWEVGIGAKPENVDGIPGPMTLATLGGGRFNVVE